MNYTDLQPGDILLFRPFPGWFGWLERMLVNYGHVAIYFDSTKRGLPLIVESIGRGVLIRSLFSYTGVEITVKRSVGANVGALAAKAAERLADNPDSWYGYLEIPRYVLPKLILAKIGRWLPTNWRLTLWILARSYHRNSTYICSELVADAYLFAGVPLVDEKTIPLPDDIAGSKNLESLGDITILKELKHETQD